MPLAARFVLIIGLSLLSLSTFAGSKANACDEQGRCVLDGRSYYVRVPASWDGVSKLPVLMHFHGWARTGRHVVNNKRVYEAAEANGVLLVAPEGENRTWQFWREPSEDASFALDVMADVGRNYPIDESGRYVSGFSYGSAMAWRLACRAGDQFTAFLPMAGTLSGMQASECQTGPTSIHHVHGLKDTVMDLPIGESGDPTVAILPWVAIGQCTDDAYETEAGRYRSYDWSECSGDTHVSIDIHSGIHSMPKGWLLAKLSQLIAAKAGS